ncbi:LSm family protein [Spartinivicinus ruber]|uniref:hypothetical protein n=1 Tax=Spartinivicinus ruber TaxID=2683272 RepID=UPI0013D42A6C|nr:hypothetical protein [Spartinivicinus ruber]
MLKVIIILIVLIAAGVGGTQYYISYKVDQALEKASSFAAMMGGDFAYRNVHTTYDGAVEVSDVELDFPASDGGGSVSTTTNMVRVKFPSLLDILQLGYRDMKELPSSLKLQIEGFTLSAADNDRLGRQFTPNADTQYPFHMSAIEMGLNQVVTDYSIGYTHDSYLAGVDFNIDYNVKGLGSSNINLKVKNVSSLQPTAFMMQDPQLQLMTISYTDESYNKLWLKNCQEKNKVSIDQCISAEIDKFNKILNRNYKLKFSDKFVTKITNYMKNSGSLKISIDLSEGSKSLMKVTQMAKEPLDLFIYQNVMLSINDEYIQPIFSQLSENEIVETEETLDQVDEKEKIVEKKKIVLKTYDEFKQYAGKKVLIITDKRKKYIGTVLEVSPDKIKIKVTLRQGNTFTYQLAYDRIKYAEVYEAEPLYRY